MALIYITGVAGSGKSSVQETLVERGYEAHDVDDRKISGAQNVKTGKIVDMPAAGLRTPEWFDDHRWRILPEPMRRLKANAKHRLVFLCGTAENENDFAQLFDKVIFLDINESTLRQRIATRVGNDYGKTENELRLILDRYKVALSEWDRMGAVIIDANKPLEEVILTILKICRP